MGIKELISKIFPEEVKVESTFEVLRNKTMGVDVSNYMFKLVTSRDNLVRDFHAEPRIDTSEYITKYWDSFKKNCDKFAIKLVLVLDGRRNSAKYDTNVLRESIRAEAFEKLNTLLLNGDDDDFESVLKLQKATMSISEDMLHSLKLWATENAVICIMSLYEADAGLQHLEDTGITDGTFSEDADFFALNSRLWATKVSVQKGTMILFNSVAIREELSKKLTVNGNITMTADHGRVLSVLLGCDFLSRPIGYGPKTALNFLSKWMTSTLEENEKSLMEIEVGKKKRKSGDIGGENTDGFPNYRVKFWQAFYMLKHPPVFKFTSLNEDTAINVGLLGVDNVMLTDAFVFEKLGFDALKEVQDIGDYRKLLMMDENIFIRTMRPLMPLLQPRNAKGQLLPWGSQHNFLKWPPVMCTNDMLNRWLRSRGVRYSNATAHSDLVQSVKSLLSEATPRDILPVDDLPDEADIDVGIGGVRWNLDGDSNFEQIRDISMTPVINHDFVYKIFGHRGGVENRAMRLIPGGHFDLATLKMCRLDCKINNAMEGCIMYQIKSTPSMKANAYAVNLIFRTGQVDGDHEADRFVKSPYSHCDCPAGQMFCSHMLGFLGIIRIIQKNVLLPYTKMIEIFPESVKALSSTGILLEYVY